MKSLRQFLYIFLITGVLAGFFVQHAHAVTLLTRVADIYSGAGGSSPSYLAVYNGVLYFTALGSNGTGRQLWKYDSATDTTSQITNFFSISPSYLTVYNGALYFSARGDSAGQQLWKYDSTTNTATRVTNIATAVFPPATNPRYLAAYNGALYFTMNGNDGAGYELWKYDGMTNIASRVADIYNGAIGSQPVDLAVYNGELYFEATGNDGAGTELWKYNSITNTPSRVADIASGPLGSSPEYLTVYNGALYFSADGQDGEGTELWKYDSATNTASRVTNLFDWWADAPKFLAVYNGALYFQANGNDGAGKELWKYDSATNTTLRVTDLYSGPNGSVPNSLAAYNGALYFNADGNDGTGFELWKLVEDGNPPATPPIPSSAPASSLPKTGFAPNRITSLVPQSTNLAYSKMGDIWLEIPSLNIKTNIVGVPKVNGTWNVDWLGNNTGWLNGTAFPTWSGNSVITGHIYNASGLPGPFVNLKNLKYGDQISVHLAGQKYIFEVTKTILVRPTDGSFAYQHLEDNSYLTLITCQTYDEKSDTYSYRRIVRAVLVDVQSE